MVWRIGLSLSAALLVVAGLYYVSFGAVYYGVYYGNGKGGPCLFACTTPYTGTTVVFLGYPIWSPPSWNNVNYAATTCTITMTTYTPQNPPLSCMYPPADLMPDHSHNYGGIFLILLGASAAVFAFRSRAVTNLDDPGRGQKTTS